MVDYSIAAIPTEYQGRMYRSRLEARWAAFFDRLSWNAEYEPFDLGAWSPDFLLRDLNVLVEVKPLITFDGGTWDKMVTACLERKLFAGATPISGILLTLLAPQLTKQKVVRLGWLLAADDGDTTPLKAFLGWLPIEDRPAWYADVIGLLPMSPHGCWFSMSDEGGLFQPNDRIPATYGIYGMELWAQACAAVQYHPE